MTLAELNEPTTQLNPYFMEEHITNSIPVLANLLRVGAYVYLFLPVFKACS
jgi:hypothetical protein